MNCRDESEKSKLVNRLKRIEGQVRGIEKMINDDKECLDIVRQIKSAAAALHGVWAEVVASHLEHCVKDALKHGDEELLDDLADYLKKVR